MQETMWSNSFRRKEGITRALWFHAFSAHVQVHVCTHTHARTHAHTLPTHAEQVPLRELRSPLNSISPALPKVPDASRLPGYNCRAARAMWQVLGTANATGRVTCGCHCGRKAKLSHLFPSALHDFNGNGVDLVVHFHRSLFPTADFHQ